ncbi:MAG: hypothetical protein QOD74_98 [Variibacter sp.]|nr:hypothetical protein [Variibacter sp.]
MALSVLFTGLAVAAVLGVIGYRVFTGEGRQPPADPLVTLPVGAKILGSSMAEGRLLLTMEVGGRVELRIFDLATLQPQGRVVVQGQ